MDLSFLTSGTGSGAVQLPDPIRLEAQRQAIGAGRRDAQMDELKLDALRRNNSASDAYNKAIAPIIQSGFDPEVVAKTLQQFPEAAPLVQKAWDDHAKRGDDRSKTDAEMFSKKTEKLLTQYSQMAGGLADAIKKDPNGVPDQMIANFYGTMAKNGLSQFMPTLPFKDWSDKAAVAQHLTELGNAFYSTSDRLKNAETGQHNRATETNATNTLTQTIARDTASNAATIRGQNVTAGTAANRLAFDKSKEGAGEKWVNDLPNGVQVNMSTGERRPITEGGVPVGVKTDAKRIGQAEQAIAVMEQARPIIEQATGSYAGAGVDLLAKVGGKSTDGAIAISKLKALEGALMMAQPRMEGPQSDKDVLLYRQMAGQIGDPTVPKAQKLAALDAIKTLHETYLNSKGTGKSATKLTTSEKMPMPDKLPDGAEVTDNETGRVMVVRGGKYVIK